MSPPAVTLTTQTRGGPQSDYKALAGIRSRKRKSIDLALLIKRLEDYEALNTEVAPSP